MVYSYKKPVRFGSKAFHKRLSKLRRRPPVYRFKRRVQYSAKVPFPLVKYCKLHLNYQGSITSTTGSFGAMGALKLNSAFDPTGALGATQPRWFDQITAIYARYAVYGCKIVAVVSNAEKIGQVGLAAYDANAPSSMLELDERENCMTRVIDSVSGSRTQIVLKKYFSMPKIVGIPKKQYLNEDDYFSAVTGDPANLVYGDLYYQTYGAQTGTVSVKLHMTLYCKFAQIQDPADS